MVNGTFRPLSLELHGVGKYREVGSVYAAVECLTLHWPVENGGAFVAALLACQEAVDGKGTAQAVRSALIVAALEAGVFIRRE
jgi:hypothetical protein